MKNVKGATGVASLMIHGISILCRWEQVLVGWIHPLGISTSISS